MHRFIVWFNCLKARFKSKRFIIPIILLLTLLFLPNDVFAADVDSNTVTPNSYELYFESMNLNNQLETRRFDANRLQLYKWGTSTANYKLIRLAPLVRFNSLGVDTSYKARVVFYIFTKYPYYYEDKFCSLWSANGEKYSCTLHREMEDQIGSNEVLLTLVYDYEWTSSGGYVEFWLNFTNFTGTPNNTEFMFDILDFQGNVSGNQIILDGLGQTNEKLDEVKDVIKDTFNGCHVGKNLFNKNIDPILHMYVDTTNNVFVDNYSSTYSTFILLPIEGGSTYTVSKLPGKTFRVATSSEVPRAGVPVLSTVANHTARSITITTPNNAKYLFVNYYNSDNGDTIGEEAMRNSLQIEKGSMATSYEPYEYSCKNKIDETNEKLDDLNNSINNDDVSGATSTGNEFFDNFNSKDNGGISRIVTMPLTLINGLVSGGTCSNLDFEVFGKELYFPSGCILWQNTRSSFVTIYHTIICGLFSYILATHLFKDIEDLKNPNKEEVSTLDL